MKRPRPSRDARPVAGRRPRLASSLRSPLRAERGRGARGATGDARAARAARVHRGWFSPPQLSRDIARRGGPLLFSRPVAGRRPRLASSLRSPLRAERGRGARGATGDARAARATRVHRGWFSPPQLGRDIARRGGPLLLLVLLSCLSSRPSLRARAAPSLHPRNLWLSFWILPNGLTTQNHRAGSCSRSVCNGPWRRPGGRFCCD